MGVTTYSCHNCGEDSIHSDYAVWCKYGGDEPYCSANCCINDCECATHILPKLKKERFQLKNKIKLLKKESKQDKKDYTGEDYDHDQRIA